MVPSNHTDASDSELLREFVRESSECAFTALVARHVDLVYSAALRQVGGDPHRAEEVTQMVFGDLAKKAASLANHPSLAGWLYTSARWAARKLLRSELRRAKHERAAADDAQAIGEAASETIQWDAVQPVLDEAMSRLSESDREAVLLRFFSNCSFADLGTRLGLSENTARMRVGRALEKLRVQLARRGVKSTAGALGATLASNAVIAAPAGMAASASASALGSAAIVAGAGSLLTSAGIFIMSKVTTAILGIGIAALTFFVVSQANKQRDVARELANAEVQTGNARQKLSEANARLAQTRDEIANINSLISSNPDATAKLEAERKETLRARRYLDDSYAPLLRKLRLSHEQLTAFIDLHREAETVSRKVANIWRETGVPFIPDEAKDFALEDVYSRMKTLIGEENLEYYKSYEETILYRRLDSDIEKQLSNIDMPLSDEQSDMLAKIHMEHGGDSIRIFLENKEKRVWTDAELTAAQKIMTPEQFIVLQDCNRAADANRKLLELNRKAAAEGRLKSKIRPQMQY